MVYLPASVAIVGAVVLLAMGISVGWGWLLAAGILMFLFA